MSDVVHDFVVQRHARVIVAGDPATADQVWLLLHGHGMLARGMLHWFRGAERPGRALVAPEALSRCYSDLSGGRRIVGASWVTKEDLAHEIEDQFAYLERAVHQLVPASVPLHVHGFSQGVSAGTRWATRTDRAVARMVCWAGTIPEDVDADRLHHQLGGAPLHLVVGDQDHRVPPERVAQDAERFRTAGLPVEVHHFAGGHRVDAGVLAVFAA